ncbi:ketopantoate reductase PanE/ApbA [Bacillus pseudomycoides DSM 12442]|nr:ketopantoate reductase PanE/ApbA [Bacillus pseudomycoides DSM 12442]
MVENHMKEGLSEWVYGYNEVLKEGLKKEISMPVWASYEPYIQSWLKKS